MAKVGLESFLLNCHTNDNLAEIEAIYGIKGFAVIVRLWQKIYITALLLFLPVLNVGLFMGARMIFNYNI